MTANWKRRILAAFGSLGAVLAFAAPLAPSGPAFAQAETPAPGSPLRTSILNALRPMVEAEVGAPVEFLISEFRVLGEWAFVLARPQKKGGGAIEWVYTRYQAAWEEGAFDDSVSALLRETPKGWLVYQYSLGGTDVPWVEWGSYYPVPPEVFPGG